MNRRDRKTVAGIIVGAVAMTFALFGGVDLLQGVFEAAVLPPGSP